MPNPAMTALMALFGLAIGSFLNVCIYRLPRRMSIVSPPSRCSACGHRLSWFENIPLVSYMVLRGRCCSCRAPVSLQYPIVELITAAMFAGLWWYYGPDLLLVPRLLLGCALIVLFFVDLEHQLLPNAITLPGILIGFVFSLLTEPGWISSLLGVLLGGGVLYATAEGYYRIRGEEGLGMGDVKMLAMIGAFLGWQLTLVTLFMASFAGSNIGGLLILFGGGGMKTALPFGTFLALGAAISATAGPSLLNWYTGLW
jgi:leader peptidase (prepilin peptidase)/N-methyltransferase